MPFKYKLQRNRLLAKATGVVTIGDLVRHRDRVAVTREFGSGFGLLMDLTGVDEIAITADQVQAFAEAEETTASRHPAVGIAIAIGDDPGSRTAELVRGYRLSSHNYVAKIRSFRSVQGAKEWLDEICGR